MDAIGAYTDVLASGPAVVMGDLNSGSDLRQQQPSSKGHSRIVSALADLGLVSAYHAFHRAEQSSPASALMRIWTRCSADRFHFVQDFGEQQTMVRESTVDRQRQTIDFGFELIDPRLQFGEAELRKITRFRERDGHIVKLLVDRFWHLL